MEVGSRLGIVEGMGIEREVLSMWFGFRVARVMPFAIARLRPCSCPVLVSSPLDPLLRRVERKLQWWGNRGGCVPIGSGFYGPGSNVYEASVAGRLHPVSW